MRTMFQLCMSSTAVNRAGSNSRGRVVAARAAARGRAGIERKRQFLAFAERYRGAEPLSKIAYDSKLHVIQHALGTHTTVQSLQGDINQMIAQLVSTIAQVNSASESLTAAAALCAVAPITAPGLFMVK